MLQSIFFCKRNSGACSAVTFSLLFILLLSGCININAKKSAPPRPPTATPAPVSETNQKARAERGRDLFHDLATDDVPDDFVACNTCHYIEENQGVLVGPNMDGLANRAGTRIAGMNANDYLRNSITTHDDFIVEGFEAGVMLSVVGDDFGNILPSEEIEHLVAYLLTLDGSEEAKGDATTIAEIAEAGEDVTDNPAETPEPTKEPLEAVVPSDDGVMIFDEIGISFEAIEGWQTLATSKNVVLSPQDANLKQGPFIGMRYGTIEELNIPNVNTSKITTTEAFYQVITDTLKSEMFFGETDNLQSTEVAGYPALTVDISGWGFGDIPDTYAGQVAALMIEAQTLIVVGIATPAEQWTAATQFNTILQSLSLASAIGKPTARHYVLSSSPSCSYDTVAFASDDIGLLHNPPPHAAPDDIDRDKGPRFGCVQCHIVHDVEMLHDSNPSCNTCHSGTPYQRHCVDCHSIHSVKIPHEPDNPGCEGCHPAGIPGEGVNLQDTLVSFLEYLFHEI